MKNNKIYSLLLLLLLENFYISFAKAVEIIPYLGVDIGLTTGYKAPNLPSNFDFIDDSNNKPKTKDNTGFNYGINIGSKLYFNNEIYTGLELSYKFGNIIDSKTKEYWYTPVFFWDEDDFKYTLSQNFGGKIFFGYKFTEEFSAFIHYGFNRYSTEIKENYATKKKKKKKENKFLSSFGLGASYVVYKNVEMKLTYEYILKNKAITNDNMHQIRFGVDYLFDI